MELLGALGIDWKILLIQALNFIVLFLVLKKMFFKPFIQEIKKEKEEKKYLEKTKKEISEEKEVWQKEKARQLAISRKKINEILKEAEKISDKIKKKSIEESERKEREVVAKIEEIKKDIFLQFENDFIKSKSEELDKKISKILGRRLSKEAVKEMDKDFWQELLLSVKKTNFFLQKSVVGKKSVVKKNENKKIKKTAIIYSAIPIEKSKELELKKILEGKFAEKKMKAEIIIKKAVKNDLLAGFSLEFSGVLIESNLSSEIKESIFS